MNSFKSNFASLICSSDPNLAPNNYTMCISNDFNVYSFGVNGFFAHGQSKKNQIYYPTQIQGLENIIMIACYYEHSLCLDINGNVFGFGRNNSGQLALPEQVQFTRIPKKINLPIIRQIACGKEFSICVSEENRVYSFGLNGNGQLGLGGYSTCYTPKLIPRLTNVEYVVCGRFHVICKTYNNEFYSWGYNHFGNLGQGDKGTYNKPTRCNNWPDNIIDIKCGHDHTLLLTEEGFVLSFGSDLSGALGVQKNSIYKQMSINIPTLIKGIPEIQRIECGDSHSMCIDINNNLWIFGYNEYGQLGLGDTTKRYKPILHPTLSNIIDISSGGYNTFVKTIDNKIYAFGKNSNSQLGIKTSKENQVTPIQVLQDKEDIWCSTIGKSKAKSARK